MWQEIVTYIFIGAAVLYTMYSLIRLVVSKKKNSTCAGC